MDKPMQSPEPTVLLISHDTAVCSAVRAALENTAPSCHFTAVTSFAAARHTVGDLAPDVIVLQESSLRPAASEHNSWPSPLADVVAALAGFAPVVILGKEEPPESLAELIAAGTADFIQAIESHFPRPPPALKNACTSHAAWPTNSPRTLARSRFPIWRSGKTSANSCVMNSTIRSPAFSATPSFSSPKPVGKMARNSPSLVSSVWKPSPRSPFACARPCAGSARHWNLAVSAAGFFLTLPIKKLNHPPPELFARRSQCAGVHRARHPPQLFRPARRAQNHLGVAAGKHHIRSVAN